MSMGKYLTSYEVYVGTYAKYNEGNLHGGWFDLCDYADYGEFLDACEKIHADEDDPEFMIQDISTPIDIFEGEPTLEEIRRFYEARDFTESSKNEHDMDIDDLLYMYYTDKTFREDNIYAYGDKEFEDSCEPNIDGQYSCFFDYESYYDSIKQEFISHELPSGETLYMC